MINILLVDDHQLFRAGLLSLFEGNAEIAIRDQAKNGKEAVNTYHKNAHNIVLMDVNMPVMDGFEASSLLLEEDPTAKIIMLTMHDDAKTIRKMIEVGAQGYLLKHCGKNELIAAINLVNSGENYFSDEAKNALVASFKSKHISDDIVLTPREKDVLKCIGEELTTQEIATKLFISVNTVESHRKNLLSKTGHKNAVGLMKFAIKNGLA